MWFPPTGRQSGPAGQAGHHTPRKRLNWPQINALRSLAMRSGGKTAVALDERQRAHIAPLWRRGIVEVWYRQVPAEMGEPILRGPFFSLSIPGFQLASAFLTPRRKREPR